MKGKENKGSGKWKKEEKEGKKEERQGKKEKRKGKLSRGNKGGKEKREIEIYSTWKFICPSEV